MNWLNAVYISIFTCFLVTLPLVNVHAQTSTSQTPTSIDVSSTGYSQEDLEKLAPEDIPSAEQLKLMGATDAEIAQIEVLRKEKIEARLAVENEATEPKSVSQEPKEVKPEVVKAEPVQTQTVVPANNESEVYGQSYFRNGNLEFFNKAANVKAPDNYILGPGDEISISIWGYSTLDEVYQIDEDGGINTKNLGRIYLKDMTLTRAKSLLKSRLGTAYDLQNSKLEINLNYSRTITVNIIGEVLKPGSYTIPAINTAFNALVSVGGVSDIGSVREIYVKRDGRTHRVLDLYEFLMNPGKDHDFFLQNNDYLYVPPSGKIVQVKGAIKRPGYYELKGKEKLSHLISFAGDLKSNTYTKNIQVHRLTDEKEIIVDVNLDSLIDNKLAYDLKDGDIISFKGIQRGITNTTSISGAIYHPGEYELQKEDRISDLILKSGGLLHDAYPDEAVLYRTREDLSTRYIKVNLKEILKNAGHESNIILQELDELYVFSRKYFSNQYQIHLNGALKNAKSIPFGDAMNLKQAINLAGGLSDEAYLDQAYIVRTTPDLETEFITVKIDTSNQLASLEEVELQKGDRINILYKETFEDKFFIEVLGEVRSPGTFLFGEGLSLKDAIYLAGGRKIEAYDLEVEISRFKGFDGTMDLSNPERVEIIKVVVTEDIEKSPELASFQLKAYDKVFVRRIPEYQLQEVVFLGGEVMFPGRYSLISKNERLVDLITRAGGLTETAFLEGANFYREWRDLGKVVLNLEKVMKRPKSSEMNYTLKGGDSILIPRVNELVTIEGAIDFPDKESGVNAPFKNGTRTGHYIRQFGGGYAKNAHRKKVKVIEANGRVRKTSKLFFANIHPKVTTGSRIVVPFKPEEIEEAKKERKPVDWNKVLTASAAVSAQIASILSVILLGRASGAWN